MNKLMLMLLMILSGVCLYLGMKLRSTNELLSVAEWKNEAYQQLQIYQLDLTNVSLIEQKILTSRSNLSLKDRKRQIDVSKLRLEYQKLAFDPIAYESSNDLQRKISNLVAGRKALIDKRNRLTAEIDKVYKF